MTYGITGIQKGLGPGEKVPLRREIDEWWFSENENDLNQRSLFIYALHEFQTMDPEDFKSYFGVAGGLLDFEPFLSFPPFITVEQVFMANLLFPGIRTGKNKSVTVLMGKQHFRHGIDHMFFCTNRGFMR
jgi:hypothetical protein